MYKVDNSHQPESEKKFPPICCWRRSSHLKLIQFDKTSGYRFFQKIKKNEKGKKLRDIDRLIFF